MKKKWYLSKTIIVNVIAGILGSIPLIDLNLLQAIGVVDVSQYLTVLGAITSVLNIILRSVTSKPLSK